MMRAFKILAVLLILGLLGLMVVGYSLNEPRPEGKPGPAADALARSMEPAVDKEAWDRTVANMARIPKYWMAEWLVANDSSSMPLTQKLLDLMDFSDTQNVCRVFCMMLQVTPTTPMPSPTRRRVFIRSMPITAATMKTMNASNDIR